MTRKSLGVVLAVTLVIAVVTVAAACRHQGKAPAEAGYQRYLLVAGRYKHGDLDADKMVEYLDVFKIDTATGRTWKYASFSSNGKLYTDWIPIGVKGPKESPR